MNRRGFLAAIPASTSLGLSGCIDEIRSTGLRGNDDERSDCPTCPDITVENPVSYDSYDVWVDPEGESETRASLVASDSDIETVTADEFEPPEALQNIDFDTEFGIAVRASTGGADTEFRSLGVEREDDSSLSIDTCIKRFDRNDVVSDHTRLLIVSHDGDVPTNVEIDTSVPGPPENWQESSSNECQ